MSSKIKKTNKNTKKANTKTTAKDQFLKDHPLFASVYKQLEKNDGDKNKPIKIFNNILSLFIIFIFLLYLYYQVEQGIAFLIAGIVISLFEILMAVIKIKKNILPKQHVFSIVFCGVFIVLFILAIFF